MVQFPDTLSKYASGRMPHCLSIDLPKNSEAWGRILMHQTELMIMLNRVRWSTGQPPNPVPISLRESHTLTHMRGQCQAGRMTATWTANVLVSGGGIQLLGDLAFRNLYELILSHWPVTPYSSVHSACGLENWKSIASSVNGSARREYIIPALENMRM